MNLTGYERVPLVSGGLSIAVRDIASQLGNRRVPILHAPGASPGGLTANWAQINQCDANTKFPLLGGGGFAYASDMWYWD